METIVLDIFESQIMEEELSKTLRVVRHNLVHEGLADIFWVAYGGHRITLEHKTAEQLLAEMGKRLDDQLRRYTTQVEEVGLVVDGIVTPVEGKPQCYIWDVKGNTPHLKYRWVKGKRQVMVSNHSFQKLYAYIWQLDKAGITTYLFPTTNALCLGVSAMVYNSMKEEHSTLKRYHRTRPILWTPDPYVGTLMGVSGAPIGERTARRLLDKYGTPFKTFLSDGSDWPLGPKLYEAVMKGIGRPV